ncbi:MAG TPA: lamin tail domain-containing protein [Stackebrandtia sp.]|jgi:hypothetical protein|uniref:lamin tail domain-containing protein n=1 Tax=Stackebrandtia sp. TaxID=2023065 RepID=UPI002D5EF293|nr:lamin tail domain-containing protein [Stackebrandtia sp.]HZE38285.1 lamin tail domain-containing protein [Stackebrandtia sp.]
MNVRKRFSVILSMLAVAIAAVIALAPGTAQAHQSGVHIGLVQYDSPGKDTGSNTSLNAEWVNIHNATSHGYQMNGWKLKDAAGHTFVFPSYTIGAGKNVKVHTGRGTKSPGHLYQQRRAYVWNNTGDTAKLYTPGGTLHDSCKWGNGGGSISCH